jgi:hypothetical protein
VWANRGKIAILIHFRSVGQISNLSFAENNKTSPYHGLHVRKPSKKYLRKGDGGVNF